jgi:ATP-dependent Lon protease
MKLFDKSSPGSADRELPLLPLKDMVVFPSMVVPIFAGRKGSIRAVEEAMSGDRRVFLSCQKSPVQEPKQSDLHVNGTIAHIIQLMKMPNGTVRILVEGQERGGIIAFTSEKEFFRAEIKPFSLNSEIDETILTHMQTVKTLFTKFSELQGKITKEVADSINKSTEPNQLVDLICSHAQLNTDQKLKLLGEIDTQERLFILAVALETENKLLELKKTIDTKVHQQIEKNQKEYFLNEQAKEINRQLGKDIDDPAGIKELRKKIDEKNLPEEVLNKSKKELDRLSKLQAMSPEAGVLRTYVEWISDLPWNETTDDGIGIDDAKQILDEDHYGMEKPKERILDFIALRQLKKKLKGPILCFVGPPGTGKTSLGKSVARALGRNFVRISLGGVRDEAEIRGHRKTYVGALPGKILQGMKKAGTINPVFLLDEVDKMSSDFRGDPSSALLEVLDPEQNVNFLDHYLEVTYDLSQVMFITTANSLYTIPFPLRDRMEVIEIPGYTEIEKLKIASQFLIPKQIEENGLAWADIRFSRDALLGIIRNYTRESGVRNLEREISQVIRKLAREAVSSGYTAQNVKAAGEKKSFKSVVGAKQVKKHLGKTKYEENLLSPDLQPGLAHGLAWTEMGGTLLPVETVVFSGKGDLALTGNLGDVMKESAHTAFSFIKSQAEVLGLPENFYSDKDIHIHVPEGAIPKDGPSAGITITSALVSVFTGKKIEGKYAMTGEITLSGRIIPVGGIKEKVLAAHRRGITHILLPAGNKKDLDDIPKEVTAKIEFIFTDSIIDALHILFPS